MAPRRPMPDASKLAIAALRARRTDLFLGMLQRAPQIAATPGVVVDAARLHDVVALRALAKAGADVNASVRNYRPLHAAIQETPHSAGATGTKEKLACVAALLDLGADPALRGAWPAMRALEVACASGERAVADLLIERGAPVDAFSAAALGRVAIVKKSLAKDASAARAKDESSLTALHFACVSRLHRESKSVATALREIAKLLLDAGADPNARARSWSHDVDPASFAISAKHFELAELLLARGADATAALPAALWNTGDEFPRFAELCIAHGAKPDRAAHEKKPLLNQLVRWGQVKPALWLMQRGANPNLTDERGWTAVHQAASRGNRRMLEAAIAAGGDVDKKAKDGTTPRALAKAKRIEVG